MIYLKIIALEDYKQYFVSRINGITTNYLQMNLVKCDIGSYWKDSRLIVIEATFSVSIPFCMSIWEELFCQIVDDYVITQDTEFTALEHFETVDALKKEKCSCFAVLNISRDSISQT